MDDRFLRIEQQIAQKRVTQEGQEAYREKMKRKFAVGQRPGSWKRTALLILFLLIVIGAIIVFLVNVS